ncbi:chaperonin 10-like protein [Aspergillus floccosus]
MAPKNKAAFIIGVNKPLEIRETPYTQPEDHELVIRTHAAALNPIDVAFYSMGPLFPWVSYPLIAGFDVAGEVVEVGASVSRFKPGDRVVGLAGGTARQPNMSLPQSGFQLYTVMREAVTAPVPDNVSLIDASVIPLALSTVASGMFSKEYLAMRHPQCPPVQADGEKEVLLVWGGSSSLGCNAIQVAVAAGYEVITTCSPHNFELVKSLGASKAFDYNSETILEELVAALDGRTTIGALAVTRGSVEPCAAVVENTSSRKFVASCVPITPEQERIGMVKCKFIWGGALENNEVGPAIYEHYLPRAMAEGAFVPAPQAKVVGKGLEAFEEALQTLQQGVSATKVVVDLSD